MRVTNVHKMRELDRKAIETYGIREELLMENAGIAAFELVSSICGGKIAGRTFTIICGVGNNGGDGLVVARKIISMKGNVQVAIVGDIERFHGASRLNYEIIAQILDHMHHITEAQQLQDLLNESHFIIDALFGTGLDRKIAGIYKTIIGMINDSGKHVISLDIPSGINGDTGEVMGVAVNATHTVSFGLPKIGNLLYPGFKYGGELYVSHISFPPELYESDELHISINLPPPLRPREPDSHKGDYGKILFIAGSAQYLGAPYFAAMSFLRAGGGLSYLATPDRISTHIGARGNEIIILSQQSTPSGSIAYENKDRLLTAADSATMTIIGPGLSLDEETQQLTRELIAEIKSPLLIDGDAITAVAANPEIIKQRPSPTIITPHTGEMARLCHVNIDFVLNSKIDLLKQTCMDLHCTIVLKGAHTLIGFSDGKIVINLSGNAGMATGGSGDVLTGSIAAMVGAGYSTDDSVKLGTFIHGFAGDLAADTIGIDGIIASDIMDYLPRALSLYRSNHDSLIHTYYHKLTVI